jgi:hypothetical protein
MARAAAESARMKALVMAGTPSVSGATTGATLL